MRTAPSLVFSALATAMLGACAGQRGEYRIQPLPGLTAGRRQHLLTGSEAGQQLCTLLRPGRFQPCHHLGQCLLMHARFLAHVQPRQVETKGSYPPLQAPQRECTGMLAAVGQQAVEHALDVLLQLVRPGIGIASTGQGLPQALAHVVQQLAIRHVGMPRAGHHLRQALAASPSPSL